MRRTRYRPASFQNATPLRWHGRRRIPKSWVIAACLVLFSTSIGAAAWLLMRKSATVGGVPVPLIIKAFNDETARNYFLIGNKRAFHDRLERIGIKEEIKAFYRPQIHDEIKLDQYIHQIFYNDTGFVGDAYYLNSQGILTLKNPVASAESFDQGFSDWYLLARQAGVVAGSKKENGVQYVISPSGKVAPYKEVAAVFPTEELNNIIKMKQQINPSPASP